MSQPYVYQPYPKARYRNGEYMAVANEAEHAAAEAEGWTDWHTDQANMAAAAEQQSDEAVELADAPKKRRGRPAKVNAE